MGSVTSLLKDAPTASVASAADLTEDSLALSFAQKHAKRFRYIALTCRWMVWSKTVWAADSTLQVPDEIRQWCRSAAPFDAKFARAGSVGAVERLAKTDRRLAATIEQWDSNPLLLNTPGGAVELQTGKLRNHLPEDYCTKSTTVAPGDKCLLWLTFVAQTFGNNSELIAFVQRVCGYCLTGTTTEHALFFLYGTGANGKSTFINTITGILGDYARIAPVETFTASSGDRHPTELAMLAGARLVTAQETEEGRPWAEAKIKAVTGGDPISARFIRRDFFTFTPQLKLVIAGNHRPSVRSVDEAIRRRVHIIPFGITVPPDQRDPSLSQKLKAEWPGILGWMIEGCFLWQKQGLSPPAVIQHATAEYLDAEDVIQLWVDEYCEKDPNFWDSSANLFGSWKLWASRNGEPAGSMRRLSQALEAKGFDRKHTNKARGFMGIRVKAGPGS